MFIKFSIYTCEWCIIYNGPKVVNMLRLHFNSLIVFKKNYMDKYNLKLRYSKKYDSSLVLLQCLLSIGKFYFLLL